MLFAHHHPARADRCSGLNPNSASSYFAPQSENEVAHSMNADECAAISKPHITRRLAFENWDSEQPSHGHGSSNRFDQYIRHSDVSYRMHSKDTEAKAKFREPVIVPPSCPSAVLWDGVATGPSLLLRHGSGCSFTVTPSFLKSLVSASNDRSSSILWGNAVLESPHATQKLPNAYHDSQFVVKESSLTPHNPYHSFCRIIFVRSSSEMHGDVSRLIPQHVYASAIMDLASRMCSANAPLESLSVFIMLAHAPCPSMPLELSMCSISSSFQASLSPIKAMAVLDPGFLLSQATTSQASSPMLGWLTIDRRRRLIPVAAGDPTLDQFAVVGVFVSGVHSLRSPIVSAACTWFNSCCNVNRSLIPSDGSFLLLLSASASHKAPLIHSLYEAHPNFSKQPFSIRCGEFVSCHGSAVTLRPQLVVPESHHPFVLAMDQLGQDLSAVSSEFFSGLHEINSLHLPNITDENQVPDRNLITPFPAPALSPQPSLHPQNQEAATSLDNPSLVFQKRAVAVPSQIADGSTCLASNSLGLVQTIIQQQNTISKLQCEKDQLLVRIMELESFVLERQMPHSPSAVTSASKNAEELCTSALIPDLVTQNIRIEDMHTSESAAATTAVAISGSSNVHCSVPAFDDMHDSFTPHSTVETKRPSSRSTSSSKSCNSSHEFRHRHDSGVPVHAAADSCEIPFTPEFLSSKLSHSHTQNPFSTSSKVNIRNQQSSVSHDASARLCRQEYRNQNPPHYESVSLAPNDSISFTVPMISYTPLSDDDDSALFASCPEFAANYSDDSSGSSHS
jgi:hypothetical protein